MSDLTPVPIAPMAARVLVLGEVSTVYFPRCPITYAKDNHLGRVWKDDAYTSGIWGG